MGESVLGVGSVIKGRYELLEELSRGGFGVLYRARQRSTGQDVAIKVLLADKLRRAPDPGAELARFTREMELIASLNHPNIVGLIDSGQVEGDGPLFTALKFIEGHPLSDLIEGEALAPRQALRLMTQVLEALDHAHRHGVIHRDLKPPNIMVMDPGPRCNAVVVDFGIAGIAQDKRASDYRSLTASGQLFGTPAYMPPEQLSGAPPKPGIDIYAWGLVFIECLTGRPAVDARSIAGIIARQISEDPIEIPAPWRWTALGEVLERAVAKDPARRFGTAYEALSALERVDLRSLPEASAAGGGRRASSVDETLDAGAFSSAAGDGGSIHPEAPTEDQPALDPDEDGADGAPPGAPGASAQVARRDGGGARQVARRDGQRPTVVVPGRTTTVTLTLPGNAWQLAGAGLAVGLLIAVTVWWLGHDRPTPPTPPTPPTASEPAQTLDAADPLRLDEIDCGRYEMPDQHGMNLNDEAFYRRKDGAHEHALCILERVVREARAMPERDATLMGAAYYELHVNWKALGQPARAYNAIRTSLRERPPAGKPGGAVCGACLGLEAGACPGCEDFERFLTATEELASSELEACQRARVALDAVDSSSAFTLTQIREEQLEARVDHCIERGFTERIRAALEAGDVAGARALLARFEEASPGSQTLHQMLAEQLAQAASGQRPPAPPGADEGDALYLRVINGLVAGTLEACEDGAEALASIDPDAHPDSAARVRDQQLTPQVHKCILRGHGQRIQALIYQKAFDEAQALAEAYAARYPERPDDHRALRARIRAGREEAAQFEVDAIRQALDARNIAGAVEALGRLRALDPDGAERLRELEALIDRTRPIARDQVYAERVPAFHAALEAGDVERARRELELLRHACPDCAERLAPLEAALAAPR